MGEPTTEQKAEELARMAADRAAELALKDADRATELAVARAVKDADVAHTLADHTAHLAEINGSQRDMAADLSSVRKALETLVSGSEAQAKFRKEMTERAGRRWSVRSVWITAGGVVAAYGTLVFLFLTTHS